MSDLVSTNAGVDTGAEDQYVCLRGIEFRSTGPSSRGLVTMLTELFHQVLAYTLCVVLIEETCEL
jgi:hypothetical protein